MDVTEMEHPGKEDNTEYWLAFTVYLRSQIAVTEKNIRKKS